MQERSRIILRDYDRQEIKRHLRYKKQDKLSGTNFCCCFCSLQGIVGIVRIAEKGQDRSYFASGFENLRAGKRLRSWFEGRYDQCWYCELDNGTGYCFDWSARRGKSRGLVEGASWLMDIASLRAGTCERCGDGSCSKGQVDHRYACICNSTRR